MAKQLTIYAARATPKRALDAIWGVGVYGSAHAVNIICGADEPDGGARGGGVL